MIQGWVDQFEIFLTESFRTFVKANDSNLAHPPPGHSLPRDCFNSNKDINVVKMS